MYFTSPSWGNMSLGTLLKKIESFIAEDPKAQYKIVIGSDSQTTQHATMYVTALIVQRVGKGSCFFYRKIKQKPMFNLRNRIYTETQLSLELVDTLKNEGISELLSEWPMEIHLDIGQKGETRQLIQEVVGWVTSIGYVAKIKPNSFGASSVADRFTG